MFETCAIGKFNLFDLR